ncbi:hypothetical protein CCM_08364 [Cordyceps militaris CM01]|uniref:Uncharacterized protein n=1 Tax=Cordyceps militaris (strain CM01) TaxID=983644 RepID=G3JR25_CORMM|nr:uncharacterized protein CCM_08364 [Cordyceps militaris CM01]EGX88321.1 hypothetical protein CCM_08364 [Cordyceps militaris CM01]
MTLSTSERATQCLTAPLNKELLLQARTGHGDFASYDERVNHADATLTSSCGRRKSPGHVFYCRKVRGKRSAPPWFGQRLHIDDTIGAGWLEYAKLAREPSFFSESNPPESSVVQRLAAKYAQNGMGVFESKNQMPRPQSCLG